MKFEAFIALRYLRAKRKQTMVSVISVISILGIAAGVMALVIALAFSTGFKEDVQGKILGATSAINLLRIDRTPMPEVRRGSAQSQRRAARDRKRSCHFQPGFYCQCLAQSGRGAERD